MADTVLNDEEIALMCDIAQNAKIIMTERKRAELKRLVDEGFLMHREHREEPGSRGYALTGKGQEKLVSLGVGVNES
jgi:DNA-binding HxlR family transcriptional regulator